MNEERLLELVAGLRGGDATGAVAQGPHADSLTFQRARELAIDPASQTPAEERHLARCARCAALVKGFQRHLQGRSRIGAVLKAILKPLAAVVLAAAPPLLNWLAASHFTNPSIAPLDWWESAQQQFVRNDVGLFVFLALLAPVLYWFGWIRRVALSVPLLALGFLAVSLGVWIVAQQQQARISQHLHSIFLEHRWIGYEPPTYNPYPEKARMPTDDEIKVDLKRLREYQFDGLITFSARGTLAHIPRLARELGFGGIIMGISIDRDDKGKPIKPVQQLEDAVQAREWVDGYCLGHNTPTDLAIPTLLEWMAELRQLTGKPVSTTAPLVSYLGDRGQPLREAGDFLCPDVHGSWHDGATPQAILHETREALLRVTELPRAKPVLLKMICYPSQGGPGLTEEAQAKFFAGVCRDLYAPPGVYLSFFSAYDLPWKNHQEHPDHWSPPEAHLGLFTADGRPKPALRVLVKGFPVQRRP